MSVNKYNFNGEGLNRFFGALEARIMDAIWASGELSIKQVQERINLENPISFNAVNTVMNRLVEKKNISPDIHKDVQLSIDQYKPKKNFYTLKRKQSH